MVDRKKQWILPTACIAGSIVLYGVLVISCLLYTSQVSPRAYTQEEAMEAFYHLMDDIEDRIRGENRSLTEVESDLDLISRDKTTGIAVRWQMCIRDRNMKAVCQICSIITDRENTAIFACAG